jgi:membrane protein insertase Oxa1/YidC/SpoIIIJ
MKLQQEMMALYKKEKVNPMSGMFTYIGSNSSFLCFI